MWQNRNQQRNRFLFLVSVDCFFCSILFRFFRGSFVSLGVCVCLQMNPKRKRPQKEREEKVESVKDFFFCNQSAKKKRQRVDRRCAQKSQSNKFTFLLFYVSEEFVFFLRAQRSTIVSHLFFSSFSFTRGAPRKNEENRKKNDTVPRPEIPQSPMEQRNPTRNKKKNKRRTDLYLEWVWLFPSSSSTFTCSIGSFLFRVFVIFVVRVRLRSDATQNLHCHWLFLYSSPLVPTGSETLSVKTPFSLRFETLCNNSGAGGRSKTNNSSNDTTTRHRRWKSKRTRRKRWSSSVSCVCGYRLFLRSFFFGVFVVELPHPTSSILKKKKFEKKNLRRWEGACLSYRGNPFREIQSTGFQKRKAKNNGRTEIISHVVVYVEPAVVSLFACSLFDYEWVTHRRRPFLFCFVFITGRNGLPRRRVCVCEWVCVSTHDWDARTRDGKKKNKMAPRVEGEKEERWKEKKENEGKSFSPTPTHTHTDCIRRCSRVDIEGMTRLWGVCRERERT